jgi:hypothetical protein
MKGFSRGSSSRAWTPAWAALALVILAISSCSTPADKLQYAHIGMSQDNLKTNVGKPNLIRGSVVNRFGQEVEIWEYELVFPDNPDAKTFKAVFSILTFGAGSPVWLVQNTKTYWFYFVDTKLARWNEAGDWQVEKERLYELPWQLLEPLGPG